MAPLDDALDQLSRVPPRGFGAARRAIVARLQKSGRSADAARVKALKVPTVPVWTVNRLARDHAELVGRLISAADRVRAAQLGRAARTDGLAAATSRHAEALADLLARARSILDAAGVRETHRMLLRVQTTLAAAAADPEQQRALRAGRLARELGAQGFDVFAGARLPERKEPPAGRTAAPAERAAKAAPRGDADHAREEREAAERASRAAAQEAERRARLEEVERLRRAAADASQALRAAREQLAAAREGVSAAEKASRAADRALSAALGTGAGRGQRSGRRRSRAGRA